MAGRPSPTVSKSGSFAHGSFSSSNSSPPKAGSQQVDGFPQHAGSMGSIFGMSPVERRGSGDRSISSSFGMTNGASSSAHIDTFPAIIIRKLPRSTSEQALRSMFVFAKDIVDVEFIPLAYPEDNGFLSAIARFRTLEGAQTARDMLHGKLNTTNEAKLIVELPRPGMGERGKTVDGSNTTRSTSSGASSKASRYNGAFQSMSPKNGDFSTLDGSVNLQNLFSPQSPLASERPRTSGKSMINDDAADDETDGLLNNTLAYANSGHDLPPPMLGRAMHSQPLTQRFAGFSLSTGNGQVQSHTHTNIGSPPASNFFNSPHSLRGTQKHLQSPFTSATPSKKGIPPMPLNSSYSQVSSPGYPLTPNGNSYRNNLSPPAANPADQNAPCNTLYVGNLPPCTSEDELKALFSRQRGYRRLCFRTKQQGPMCFVEFEDIGAATRCLNELYGYVLSSSSMNGGAVGGGSGWGSGGMGGYGKGGVRGGIRLSFSKNPLGVRQGPGTNGGMISPTSPTSPYMGGFGGQAFGIPGFTTASGPPPGLSVPPGLQSAAPAINMDLGMGWGSAGASGLGAMFGGSHGYGAHVGVSYPGRGANNYDPFTMNGFGGNAGGGGVDAGGGRSYAEYISGR